MKYINFLFLFSFFCIKARATNVINVGDTTISSNWDAGGSVLNITGKISGAYQISNAIIQANPFVQIFDTTVTLGANIQCGQFSASWYGAKTANADNSKQLQMAINACMNQPYKLIIQPGLYNISKTLWVAIYDSVNNRYMQVTITIEGYSHYWGDGGSRIAYSGDDNAINFQLNKGTNISGLIIKGGWISPGGSMYDYFNLSDSQYVNQGTSGNGIGIAIDPTSAVGQNSGSTGCYFHDMQITGFKKLISISNGAVQNGECMVFEKIQFGQAYYGVVTHQPQEKYNVFRDIYSWSSINYIFFISRGNYYVDGMNIAGRARNLMYLGSGSFFPSYFKNIYAEQLGSIGIVSSWLSVSISDCHFDFAYISDVGVHTLVTSNGNSTQFNNCNFRYYGNSDPMVLGGSATYNNCTFTDPNIIRNNPNNLFIVPKNNALNIYQKFFFIGQDTTTKQSPNAVKIILRKSHLSE